MNCNVCGSVADNVALTEGRMEGTVMGYTGIKRSTNVRNATHSHVPEHMQIERNTIKYEALNDHD
jgi:hypothetical protein